MQEMVILNQMTTATQHLIEFFEQLLLNLTARKDGIVQQEDILDLVSHMKNGGNVENVLVPSVDQEFFADLLRRNHVSFVACEITNPETKEPQVMFLFKGTDNQSVQIAVDDYHRHLDGLCHELDAKSFFEANQRKGYVSIEGLTQAELIVFRQEAEKYNMDFVVLDSAKEDGTYTICANSKNYLSRAINDMLYMTSGPDGREYMKKVQEFGRTQRDFVEEVKTVSKEKGTSYIIDAEHPNQIIAIQNEGYRVHSMGIDVTETPTGEIVRTPVEYRHHFGKRIDHDFLAEVKRMAHPVLVKADNAKDMLPFIVGVNNQGTLEVTEHFTNTDYLKGLRKNLQEMDPAIVRFPKHDKEILLEPGNLKTYTNLPSFVIKEIESAKIDGVYVRVRDVAYTPDAEDKIQAILNENLYKGLSPLRKLEEEMMYKNHGRGRLKNLSQEETYFVVDAAAPSKKYFSVSKEGANLIVGQNEMLHKPAGASDYDEFIVDFIQEMEVPIILTKEEYENDVIENVVASRLFEQSDNKAIEYIQDMDADERAALDTYVFMTPEQLEDETLTPAQKEVIERRKTLIIQDEAPTTTKTLEFREKNATREARERGEEQER